MRNLLFVTCLVFLTAASSAYAQYFELEATVKNLALEQGGDHAKIQVPIQPTDNQGITEWSQPVSGHTQEETHVEAESNTLSVVTPAQSVPPVPLDFRTSQISATQVTLSWTDSPGETSYQLERRVTHNGLWEPLATLHADSTTYVDTSVSSYVTYYYRISAINDQGASTLSEELEATTGPKVAVLEDDFDPDYDATLWTSVSGGSSVDHGAGFNGTRALYFPQGGHAQTRRLPETDDYRLDFSIRAGNMARDGMHWSDASQGEKIILEASHEGVGWHTVRTFDLASATFKNWTDFSIKLPFFARTVRWRHEGSNGQQSPWALDNVRVLAWTDQNIWFNEQPVSQLIDLGSTATFKVAVGQSRATFQWYKNDEPIPNATQSTYQIQNVQPSDGALYQCYISVNDGYLVRGISYPAHLGVIEKITDHSLSVEVGTSFQLIIKVHHAPEWLLSSNRPLATYSWKLASGSPIEYEGHNVRGISTPILNIDKIRKGAEAVYFCQIKFHHLDLVDVGPFNVEVRQLPEITPIPPVHVFEGGPVNIPVTISDPKALTWVIGLPTGLTYDSQTRRITGRLMEIKMHMLTVFAENLQGKVSMDFPLHVDPFPSHILGAYQGVFLEGDGEYQHGGQITCQVAKKGSASGTLMLRGKTHRFTSTLSDRKLSEGVIFEAPFKDIDGRELLVGIRQEQDLLNSPLSRQYETYIRELTAEVGDDLCEGVAMRNIWFNSKDAPEPGLLNAALTANESTVFPEPAHPQGTGYLSLTLSPRGTVKIKGRLADGQAVLGSTILGDSRDIPIFMNLYRGTGSFATVVNHVRSTLSGNATWGKDPQPANSKDRIHKEGFARHALEVRGGNYSRLNPASSWYQGGWTLNLTGAGLDTETGLTQNFVFDRGRAVFPRLPAENPHKFTFKLNPTTGLFTGGFKLQDENPAKPGQMIRRSVTFHGCVIPDQETLPIGHFLLPELPEDKNTKTPIWSGKVEVLRRVE